MVISGALILSVLLEATYILVHNIALQKKPFSFLITAHFLLQSPDYVTKPGIGKIENPALLKNVNEQQNFSTDSSDFA